MKHIQENGSLKSEAAPNQEAAAHDRNRGRDMGLERNGVVVDCGGARSYKRARRGRGRDSELSMQMLTQNVTSMSPHNRHRCTGCALPCGSRIVSPLPLARRQGR